MNLIEDDPLRWAAAQTTDPVRQRMLLALAQRAAAQAAGPLRNKLLAKLQQRAARPPLPPLPSLPRQPDASSAAAAPGALSLGALLARLQADAGPELRHVRAHQSTWRELRVAKSLAELQAPLAANLGPLNGQALATRVLQQLHGLAPDYVVRLLTQMETIAALEQLPSPSHEGEKKPARAAAVKRKVSERRR